ncbi:MAG: hypothetical protein H3C43_03480 [Leptonema sp. (in: Bacteria)]|nr:hypothetical protein [Leptonema sp. (in: bacteria)]
MSSIIESFQQFLYRVADRTEDWYTKEWLTIGSIVLLLLITFAQLIYFLIPNQKPINLFDPNLVAEMTFVEFQEPTDTVQVETRDLSDEIIETDKTEEKPINWANAVDPTMDFDQRYSARLFVNIGPNDYPERARRSNLGTVTAAVTLYIAANGQIKDVKIRTIRTSSGNLDAFQDEFAQSVRKIFLTQAKLASAPYSSGGEARDFTWDTTVTFTLQ